MISILQIALFVIGLLNQDPSRVTELQQVQQAITQDLSGSSQTVQPSTSTAVTPTTSTQTTSQSTQSSQTITTQPVTQPTHSVTFAQGDAKLCYDGSEFYFGGLTFDGNATKWTINYTATSDSNLHNQILDISNFEATSIVNNPTGSLPGKGYGYFTGSLVGIENAQIGTEDVITLTSATDENGNQVSGFPITLDTGVIASCQN